MAWRRTLLCKLGIHRPCARCSIGDDRYHCERCWYHWGTY